MFSLQKRSTHPKAFRLKQRPLFRRSVSGCCRLPNSGRLDLGPKQARPHLVVMGPLVSFFCRRAPLQTDAEERKTVPQEAMKRQLVRVVLGFCDLHPVCAIEKLYEAWIEPVDTPTDTQTDTQSIHNRCPCLPTPTSCPVAPRVFGLFSSHLEFLAIGLVQARGVPAFPAARLAGQRVSSLAAQEPAAHAGGFQLASISPSPPLDFYEELDL